MSIVVDLPSGCAQESVGTSFVIDDQPPGRLDINVHDDIHVGLDDSKVELWMAGNFAPAWFDEAKKAAGTDGDKDEMAKPREIVFAVCAIESYLLEWVRDEVLNRNFQRLKHYFPADNKRRNSGIDERWKEVINHLYEDGVIPTKPDFGLPYWEHFLLLLKFRNGLLHGRASRPDTDRLPEPEKPGPTNEQLVQLPQGWAFQVVAEVIRKLHGALGTSPPKWLSTQIGPPDMLTHSDIGHLTVPDQLFGYADAYRSASAVLCQKVDSDATFRTWPHAAAVLMLAAHAVELFLKGALLKGTGGEVWSYGHKIDKLAVKYRETFKDNPSLTWDIPFASTLTETEWMAQMKKLNPDTPEAYFKGLISATPDPTILYRYPVNKFGKDWPGLYGFEPHSFLLTLSQVEGDFNRIRTQLDTLPQPPDPAPIQKMASPTGTLDDILTNGIQVDLYRAEQCIALRETITEHADQINAASLGNVFGNLQQILHQFALLSVAKVFEVPDKRYPLRSIPAALTLLKTHADDLVIQNKDDLLKELIKFGHRVEDLNQLADADLTITLATEFGHRRPKAVKNSDNSLDKSLEIIRTARDKFISHNEVIRLEELADTPSIDRLHELMQFGYEFLQTLGRGYLSVSYTCTAGEFLKTTDAAEASRGLRRLFQTLNITGEETSI